MLKRFQVSNFKQFNSLEWNFSKVRSYDFSRGCLTETSAGNFVKTALVFGRNSSGKSNLGLAVFDILQHLSGKAAKRTLTHTTQMPTILMKPSNLAIPSCWTARKLSIPTAKFPVLNYQQSLY